MLYTYAVLIVSSLIAVVAAGCIVVYVSLPERQSTREIGRLYSGHISTTTLKMGQKFYNVEFVNPSATVRCILLLSAVLFAFAIFLFLSGSFERTQSGVVLPVESLADEIARLVHDKRSIQTGRSWAHNEPTQIRMIFLNPDGDTWRISLFGILPDIREAFEIPAGPFANCEEISPEEGEWRQFEVRSNNVIADTTWIFHNYLHYPDGTKMELSVTDGEAFARRPERATSAPI